MTGLTVARAIVRDTRGVYHGARWFNGHFYLVCCEGDEGDTMQLVPGIPDTVVEEQLCERQWPKRDSDVPETGR